MAMRDDEFTKENLYEFPETASETTQRQTQKHSKNRARKNQREASLQEFCSRTTMHGILDWYSAQGMLPKCLWTFALLAAVGISAFGIYTCLMEFYVNPIVTTLSVVPEDRLEFPVVYICPSNFINSSLQSKASRDTRNLARYFKAASNVSEGIIGSKTKVVHKLAPSIHLETAPEILEIYYPSDMKPTLLDYQQNLFDVSYQTNSFVKECYFQSQPLSCGSIASQILDKDYGVCFAIQVKDPQHVPGLGLTVLLDLNTELYPEPITSDGVMVRIDKNLNPLSYEDIFVSPGTYSKLMISAVERKLISVSTFSKTPQICIKKRDFLVLNNLTYSREVCQFDCFQSMVRNNCDCFLALDARFIHPKFYNDSNFCKSVDYQECVQDITKNESVNELFRLCSSNCHRACNEWRFQSSLSFQKLPSKSLRDFYGKFKKDYEDFSSSKQQIVLVTNETGAVTGSKIETAQTDWDAIPKDVRIDRWPDNLIMLDVSFSKIEYTRISQSPAMTINTLLSNIGGQCGLWLGASLVTIIQFIVYFGKLGVGLCKQSKEKDQE